MEDPAIYGGGYEPGVQRYYNKAAEYISANLDKKISVEEIAAHTGISSGYLSRLFKEFSGRTIVDYINYLKIEKVKELMGTMNLSLRQAGESVGIGDHNYLSRLFKKYTKLSVREYNLHDISAIAPEVI